VLLTTNVDENTGYDKEEDRIFSTSLELQVVSHS